MLHIELSENLVELSPKILICYSYMLQQFHYMLLFQQLKLHMLSQMKNQGGTNRRFDRFRNGKIEI